jgi:neutral ceramidase
MMADIPWLRVLKEGGYEGDTSMIPYGMPASWGLVLEENIVVKVHELMKEVQARVGRP